MFYLNQLWFQLGKHPLRGLAFLLLGALGVAGASQKSFLDSHLAKFVQSPERGSYFYALISSQHSAEQLRRKLIALPGVRRIQILAPEAIGKKAQSLLDGHDLDFKKELAQMNYFGLKIVLSEKIKPRAQQLIGDYLVRLVRDQDIILGNIKRFGLASNTSQLLEWVRKVGSFLAVGLLFLAWFFAGVWILGPIKKMAYVVEQFQRRSHVALKTYAVASGVAMALGIVLSLTMGKAQWMGLTVAAFPLILNFLIAGKKYQWED